VRTRRLAMSLAFVKFVNDVNLMCAPFNARHGRDQ
jgi:hypothetical protein